MKALKIIAILVFVVTVGCASGNKNYFPKDALSNIENRISILHRVEIEKKGIPAITTFKIFMNDGLYTETVDNHGVWEIRGLYDDGREITGYAYNPKVDSWGFLMLRAEVHDQKDEIENAKFLLFSMDYGWTYNLGGFQLPDSQAESVPEKEDVLLYDPEKYDKDPEYRKKLFDTYGTTLAELDRYFFQYYEATGMDMAETFKEGLRRQGISYPSNFGYEDVKELYTVVQEIRVGSEEWKRHREKIDEITVSNPKMLGGEIRASFVSLEKYKMFSIQKPGRTFGERMMRNGVYVPIGPSLEGVGIGAGVNLINNAVNAATDTELKEGISGRTSVIRYDLAPTIRNLSELYRKIIYERNRKIEELMEENYKLKKYLYYQEAEK